MNEIITPLQFFAALAAACLNRQQPDVIDYLIEQNRVLLELLGDKKRSLTSEMRRRLAVKTKAVGRKGLCRPRIMKDIQALTGRMVLENPRWGYTRIMGALKNVGHVVSRGTVANVLAENGIEPAPERGKHTRWRDFLRAHWDALATSVPPM